MKVRPVRIKEGDLERLAVIAARRSRAGPGTTNVSELIRFAVERLLEDVEEGRLHPIHLTPVAKGKEAVA